MAAPLAVRYLVVPNHDAPAGAGAHPYPVPADVLAGLAMQTDLQLVNVDAGGLLGGGHQRAVRGPGEREGAGLIDGDHGATG